eukprot:gene7696-biopygen10591
MEIEELHPQSFLPPVGEQHTGTCVAQFYRAASVRSASATVSPWERGQRALGALARACGGGRALAHPNRVHVCARTCACVFVHARARGSVCHRHRRTQRQAQATTRTLTRMPMQTLTDIDAGTDAGIGAVADADTCTDTDTVTGAGTDVLTRAQVCLCVCLCLCLSLRQCPCLSPRLCLGHCARTCRASDKQPRRGNRTVARARRGRGAGCKHFFLAWGGAGVARARRGYALFPPGRNVHTRVRPASVSLDAVVRPASGPRPLPFVPCPPLRQIHPPPRPRKSFLGDLGGEERGRRAAVPCATLVWAPGRVSPCGILVLLVLRHK